MFVIKVGNSISYLNNKLPRQIEWDVKKATCYKDESKYVRTKDWKLCIQNLFDSNTYSFPTGLIRRVCEVLHRNGIKYKIEDSRTLPPKDYLNLKTYVDEPTAYSDQDLARRALVESPSGRGICVLPTGVGKTRVMKDTIQSLGVNTLIIEPGINLRHQIFDYMEECFGSKYVGLLDKEGPNKPITVSNLDALTNLDPDQLKDFHCVMFDEYHHEACATARTINETKLDHIYYKYAFTATNFRNNKNEQVLLESVMANEVYSITPIEAIERNYIIPIDYHCQTIHDRLPAIDNAQPFPPSEAELSDMWERKKKAMPYHQVYKTFIVNEEQRNEAIIQQANELKEQGIPTLILVKEIKHGELLRSQIDDALFVNGTEKKEFNHSILSDFNSEKVPILIGTSVIGEGIDTKPAGAVILANAEKAESKVMQNIGRVVRKYPGQLRGHVYDFQDNGHDTTSKHSKRRKRVVKKHFGIKPK